MEDGKMKIKLGMFRGGPQMMALARLFQFQGFSVGVTLALKRLAKALEAEQRTWNETDQALLKKYARKDEKGEPVIKVEGGRQSYDVDDSDRMALNQEREQLDATDVALPLDRIPLMKLDVPGFQLSAHEMILLDGFLQEPAEGEEEPKNKVQKLRG